MILDIGLPTEPFFSVIIPTFNRHHLVTKAIDSVLAQTLTEWELIIIDDGSIDGSYDWIDVYAREDARIRYHYSKNRGLALARNLGISMGQGKYFTFLDSDDEYRADHLDIRAAYLREHPDVELLHGGVEVIGPDMVADKFDPTRQIPISECVVGGTFCIKRELAERLHGFRNVPYGDDNDFFSRATASGAIIHKMDAPTYRYNRLEPDSLCAIVEREGLEGIRKFRGISNGEENDNV